MSGLILFVTDKNIRNQNKYLYPIGKSRMQPLGILVFSCIMGTLGFQVLIEGIRQLIGDEHTHHLEHLVLTIAIMVSAIILKFSCFCTVERASRSPCRRTRRITERRRDQHGRFGRRAHRR